MASKPKPAPSPLVVSTECTWGIGDLVLEANIPTAVPADQLDAVLALSGVVPLGPATPTPIVTPSEE